LRLIVFVVGGRFSESFSRKKRRLPAVRFIFPSDKIFSRTGRKAYLEELASIK
jgi:hypothetical protein